MRLICAVLLLLLLCPAPCPGDNLVYNPSFEEADPKGQSPAGWTPAGVIPFELRDDGGRTGARYVRITDPKPDLGLSIESRRVPARIGGTYTASAWTRTAGKGRPGVYINFYDDTDIRVHHVYQRAKGSADAWEEVVVSAVAPEGAVEVCVCVYSYSGDVGAFDFDDVFLAVQGGDEPRFSRAPRAQPREMSMTDIGSRLELFVDGFMIDAMTGDARRVLHPPQPREVALNLDRPWEGPFCGYFTLMPLEEGFRLYYRGWPDLKKPDYVCYAESKDGIAFTRPNVGLFEFDGSKQNNIVWQGPGCHNFTPFRDTNPAAAPEQRFKAVASAGPKGSLVPFVSADGIRWSMLQKEPVITKGAFDSQNLAFWDDVRGEYVCYFRIFKDGVRDISRCVSKDFLRWSEPEPLSYGHAPSEHLYTNAIVPYFRAPHILLGFPCRFMPSRRKIAGHKEAGINDGVLMSSRDGLRWERWFEAFLRPGQDPLCWTDRNNYIAWGLAPTSADEISLYWTEHYRQPTCRLRRGTVRTDGFVSVGAGAGGGELLTRPFVFDGRALVVNYDTSAAGSIRFELCDENGRPHPGFAITQSERLYGSEIAREVKWTNADVGVLAGKPVRLRVFLKDADIYSFQFVK